MNSLRPLVSAVIPTRNRPALVERAVRSALRQTLTELEIIVVVDGPDRATIAGLQAIKCNDRRLRVLPLARNVGGSDARNAGVKAAKGRWIALLDDDDEWMPDKLEKQLALGEASPHRFPVISSKVIGRTPAADYVWPRSAPSGPIADYLMRRTGLFQGEGLLQSSTLVGLRELFQTCPFMSGLRRHQDWDWLIRVLRLPGVGLEFVPEPLAIWHVEEDRGSICSIRDWRYSLDWINKMRSDLSAETYAAFLLTDLSAAASNQRDWSAFFPLVASAFRNGKPRSIHLALYFGMWLLPLDLRRSIRRRLLGSVRGGSGSK